MGIWQAAGLKLAHDYVQAFNNMAKEVYFSIIVAHVYSF